MLKNATGSSYLLGHIHHEIGAEKSSGLMVYLSWLELRTNGDCVVFFPPPFPCEWAPRIRGRTIFANWVNMRRRRVILANWFGLVTLCQGGAGRLCSPNVVMVQVQSPAGTVGSKQ
jgi:hypothetical protein